jgi:hypothetical protein
MFFASALLFCQLGATKRDDKTTMHRQVDFVYLIEEVSGFQRIDLHSW